MVPFREEWYHFFIYIAVTLFIGNRRGWAIGLSGFTKDASEALIPQTRQTYNIAAIIFSLALY